MLRFRGSQSFRQRLVFATLAGRAVRIDDIRAQDQSPGLRDFEASFLRLLEKISNGCIVEINETGGYRQAGGAPAGWRGGGRVCVQGRPCGVATVWCVPNAVLKLRVTLDAGHMRAGTSLRYKPGVLLGGAGLTHDCGTSRSVGYFLEALVVLGLFGKKVRGPGAHGSSSGTRSWSGGAVAVGTTLQLHWGPQGWGPCSVPSATRAAGLGSTTWLQPPALRCFLGLLHCFAPPHFSLQVNPSPPLNQRTFNSSPTHSPCPSPCAASPTTTWTLGWTRSAL